MINMYSGYVVNMFPNMEMFLFFDVPQIRVWRVLEYLPMETFQFHLSSVGFDFVTCLKPIHKLLNFSTSFLESPSKNKFATVGWLSTSNPGRHCCQIPRLH